MLAPSQGIHLVFDRSFLRGNTAIMVPHTSDGRVLFAIPGMGTRSSAPRIRRSTRHRTSPLRLSKRSTSFWKQRASTLAGLRGAATPQRFCRHPAAGEGGGRRPVRPRRCRAITRFISTRSGLLTIVGGKWTTYRHMAEDSSESRHHPG